MPQRAKRPCAGRCGTLVETGFCPACQERGKGSAGRKTAAQRGYDGKWQRYRRLFLSEHPLCADPFGLHGLVLVLATVVDHIVPHRGDKRLFWRGSNHQGLCKS